MNTANYFCEWQHPCKDIHEGRPGIACTAHLAEARVFECPYTSMAHATAGVFPCVDAEPITKKGKHNERRCNH